MCLLCAEILVLLLLCVPISVVSKVKRLKVKQKTFEVNFNEQFLWTIITMICVVELLLVL